MSKSYTTSDLATMAVITRGIDMDSAERALELAEIFDGRGSNEGVHGNIEEMGWYYDAAELLRWAAEVMRVNTDWLIVQYNDGPAAYDRHDKGHAIECAKEMGAQVVELIIKPTPPNLGDNNG